MTDLIAVLGPPSPVTWHWYSASSASFTGDIDRDQSPTNVISLNNLTTLLPSYTFLTPSQIFTNEFNVLLLISFMMYDLFIQGDGVTQRLLNILKDFNVLSVRLILALQIILEYKKEHFY